MSHQTNIAGHRPWTDTAFYVASICCFAASMAFATLLLNSVYWNTTFYRHHQYGYWHLRSWKGQFEFSKTEFTALNTPSIGFVRTRTERWEEIIGKYSGGPPQGLRMLGFSWGDCGINTVRLVVPYWSMALGSGAMCLTLRPRPRLQFSLRELFVFATIAVLVIGALESLLLLVAISEF